MSDPREDRVVSAPREDRNRRLRQMAATLGSATPAGRQDAPDIRSLLKDEERLREAAQAFCDVEPNERNEDGRWIGGGPGGRYRDALRALRAALSAPPEEGRAEPKKTCAHCDWEASCLDREGRPACAAHCCCEA